MFTLIDETPLSDIPEPIESSISIEGLEEHRILKADGDDTSDDSNKMQSPPGISYTISNAPSGNGRIIAFYMNVLNLTKQAINQFVMLCEVLVRPEDILMVHFNSSIYCEEAETIHNAILDCRAKRKIGSAPYTLNTAALYPRFQVV